MGRFPAWIWTLPQVIAFKSYQATSCAYDKVFNFLFLVRFHILSMFFIIWVFFTVLVAANIIHTQCRLHCWGGKMQKYGDHIHVFSFKITLIWVMSLNCIAELLRRCLCGYVWKITSLLDIMIFWKILERRHTTDLVSYCWTANMLFLLAC